MIQVQDASKRYFQAGEPFLALDEVRFEVPDGQFLFISGTSGAGKSTLLNLLAGILRPTTGTVLHDGVDVHRLGDTALSRFRSERIGFVYQHFNLIPWQTVAENVRAPLYFERPAGGRHAERVGEVLERVGIGEKRGEYPPHLSGGQLQRAAIARAVVRRPRLLLADEPTGNLDAVTGREIIRLFAELNKEGITVLVVSHDERFAEVADARLVLEYGKLKGGTRPRAMAAGPRGRGGKR